MNRLDNEYYSHEQMDKLLKSNRSITYKSQLLDNNNVPLGDITASGTINFSANCEIMRIANLEVKEYKDIDFINNRIKTYMVVNTPLGKVEYPLGVFLIASPDRETNGMSITRNLECYDYAQILKEDKFTNRYMIAKGQLYTNAINTLLESALLFNHDIFVSPLTIPTDIEFEIGTSKLDAINQLLKAINYTPLWFDENGVAKSSVYVSPSMRISEYTYSTDNESIVFQEVKESLDTFNIPNKIVRYTDNPEGAFLRAEWVNNNPSSKLSTVSRRRNIVDIESVSDIANQSTLDQYVQRIAEEQMLYQEINFDTAIMPHHTYNNCLKIVNKDLGINSTYIETEWNINLEVGGRMNHICRKLVNI